MTITQVKEINEKIIELADYIRRYRLETIAAIKVSNKPVDIVIRMGNVDHQLGYACEDFAQAYYFGTTLKDLTFADQTLNSAMKAVYHAYYYRYHVGDDISLEEISLWIDLFSLIY